MKQQPPDGRSTTIINRVTPTVVRRRVVEVPAGAGKTPIGYAATDDDDEAGPPSSVNVARALASLRGHELQRLEEILSDEEREEREQVRASEQADRPPPSLPRVPTPPSVRVGPTISLTLLAARLGVDPQEVVTALVTHGFFSVTVKTVLPRETARSAATLFGYQIEETDEVETPPSKKASAKTGAKPSAKAGAKTSKKTAAATRRTSRRA